MTPLLRSAVLMFILLATAASAQTVRTIRWAAIGDAVSNAGWPARTGIRLPADSIINYGHPGGTALRSGDSSYWTSGRLAQIFAYQPDIVSIHLGSADSKPVNWADSASFVNDFKALIDTLASMPSQPRILVVYPTPVWTDESGTQAPGLRRNSVIEQSILPRLRVLAAEKGADSVNLHSPLLARQSLFANGITPSTAGNDTLGRLVFRAFVDQSIRIMCVGNSITQAAGTTSGVGVKDAYSLRLNMMLGKRYWVWNGGKSGWWMQRAQLPGASSAYKSYVTDKPLMDTLFMMKPHFITIKLGTNDARQNFWNTARFVTDYRHFIDTLYDNMTPKPKIVPLKAIPAWRNGSGNWAFANSGYTAEQNGINGDIIRDSLSPAIDVIAASRATQVALVVDLHTPFLTLQSLVPDFVHPNRVGQDSLARKLHRALLPIVTSIAPPSPSGRPGGAASHSLRRVYLAGDKVPDWMRGARILSLDGKAARIGQNGTLPAGVYFVKLEQRIEKLEVRSEK
jgi:lysophospholipase L1-like esterase